MCGIIGIIAKNNNSLKSLDPNKIKKILEHRGPNDFGYWIKDNINFFHNRLSIIDLSKHGSQPMESFCGRYVITYNGEIYNFIEIKNKIQKKIKINWMGNSDTEVLINSISLYGLEQTLSIIRGMFAFSVWDKYEKKLYLIRDRVGQKPLYYGYLDGNFIFGSELKIFHSIFKKKIPIDIQSMALMIEYGYIPTPKSVFQNIQKLEQGCLLVFDYNSDHMIKKKWWSLENISSANDTSDNSESSNLFNNIFRNAVKEQMVADVPLGTFLSGGLDSSLVTSVMQELHSKPIKTFTIGFNNNHFNEAINAKKIANHLGTEHNELYLNFNDLNNILPKIPQSFDEPFADSSQIPTMLVSQFAAKEVAVSLSGDGGDELFGGYNRYIWLKKINRIFLKLPKKIKILIIYLISTLENKLGHLFIDMLFSKKINNPREKMYKLKNILNTDNVWGTYYSLLSQWNGNLPFNKNYIYEDKFKQKFNDINCSNLGDKMMHFDFNNYLADDILVKLDRSAMSFSLETRVPFLDERVIDYAFSLNENKKINNNITKIPIRNLLNKYLPKSLINQPKKGFGIPIGILLRNELKTWAKDLLNSEKLYSENILDKTKIDKIWKSHQEGKNYEYQIWTLLMLSSWKEEWC